MNCGLATTTHSQCMLQPVHPEHVDIYWASLDPETPEGAEVLSAYLKWKPWILLLEPYVPTTDLLHVTLYSNRRGDEVYQDQFQDGLESKMWEIQSGKIMWKKRE